MYQVSFWTAVHSNILECDNVHFGTNVLEETATLILRAYQCATIKSHMFNLT